MSILGRCKQRNNLYSHVKAATESDFSIVSEVKGAGSTTEAHCGHYKPIYSAPMFTASSPALPVGVGEVKYQIFPNRWGPVTVNRAFAEKGFSYRIKIGSLSRRKFLSFFFFFLLCSYLELGFEVLRQEEESHLLRYSRNTQKARVPGGCAQWLHCLRTSLWTYCLWEISQLARLSLVQSQRHP